ncbi:hypothetical protein FF3_00426 [Fretibacterium fastidiosum]
MAGEVDLQKVALRIAHRIRAIAIREKLVPVGKPDPDSGKRTGGELRKSIHVSSVPGGAMVGTNKVYARAVHEGRQALIIRPRRRKALRWKGGEGKYLFAKKVFQPARKGRPFFRSAADLFEQNLDKEIAGIALDDELAEHLAANLRKQGIDVKVQ